MFKYGTLLLVYCNDVRLTLFQNTFSILQPMFNKCLENLKKILNQVNQISIKLSSFLYMYKNICDP